MQGRQAATTIGIIGGGQLGRMLTLAAIPLGFKVIALDPVKNCPAAQVGAREITAHFYDSKAIEKLAEQADFITIEIEHVDADILERIAASGKPVHTTPQTIRIIQNKYQQKVFLNDAGVKVVPFREIHGSKDAVAALGDFNGSMLIKTSFGAYDGRGNMLVHDEREIDAALKIFAGKQLYAEKYISFKKELAAIVAKGYDGTIASYPIVETIHERNICQEVLAPAQISETTRDHAERMARTVVQLLEGAGVYAIELFLAVNDEVYINEIAPRVHNSGHLTIEACTTSQFEQHIRAITGLPLGQTDMRVPAAAMVNILGERNGPVAIQGMAEALKIPYTKVHLYGKEPTKIDRKMGHITATGASIQEAQERARQAREVFKI